jgi:hypothetical protein
MADPSGLVSRADLVNHEWSREIKPVQSAFRSGTFLIGS